MTSTAHAKQKRADVLAADHHQDRETKTRLAEQDVADRVAARRLREAEAQQDLQDREDDRKRRRVLVDLEIEERRAALVERSAQREMTEVLVQLLKSHSANLGTK